MRVEVYQVTVPLKGGILRFRDAEAMDEVVPFPAPPKVEVSGVSDGSAKVSNVT